MTDSIAQTREQRRLVPHGREGSDLDTYQEGFDAAAAQLGKWFASDAPQEIADGALAAVEGVEGVDRAQYAAAAIGYAVFQGLPFDPHQHGFVAATVEFGRWLGSEEGQKAVAADGWGAVGLAIERGEAFVDG